MTYLIDTKTYLPSHPAPTTVSEVISALENFKREYGDLPIEMITHTDKGVTCYQDIFYAYNTYDDGTKNISIQSFPY